MPLRSRIFEPDDLIECVCGAVVWRQASGVRWLFEAAHWWQPRTIHLCPRGRHGG